MTPAREFDPAVTEIMDREQPVSAELERDLANLASMNRWFGGHRLVRRFLRRWLAGAREVSILDLATASGDIPRMVVDWARRRGIRVGIEAVDFQDASVAVARRWSSGHPEIRYVRGDIRSYDPGLRFDVVLCSLALHHFSRDEAVGVLRRCRELSAGRVLAADLERSRPGRLAVDAVTRVIYREAMTRHDAMLSVRRAFSFCEFRDLARDAGWRGFGHARFAFARQAVWLDGVENCV